MSIRGIVFDKDGTLFDFEASWGGWAAQTLLRLAGGDQQRAAGIGRAVGFDLASGRFSPDSILIAGTMGEVTDALLPHVPQFERAALHTRLLDEASAAPQAQAVPLAPLLSGLKARGLKLGVATNDSIDPAVAHLQEAQIFQFFDFVAGYDSGYGAKPGPGQLQAFCKETGLGAETCVMVGDSLHDLKAGRAAGMRTIGVLTGIADTAELSPFADAVLPDIGHIPHWLDTQSGI